MQYYEYQLYPIHDEIQIIFRINQSWKIHELTFPKQEVNKMYIEMILHRAIRTRFEAVANKVPAGLSAIAANSPV